MRRIAYLATLHMRLVREADKAWKRDIFRAIRLKELSRRVFDKLWKEERRFL